MTRSEQSGLPVGRIDGVSTEERPVPPAHKGEPTGTPPEWFKAIEAAQTKIPPCNACLGHPNFTTCVCGPTAYVILCEALPHLRRMHFQEAADLLDMEAERMRSIVQSGEWQGAASFLRGIE